MKVDETLEPEEPEPWWIERRDNDEDEWTSARYERAMKGKGRIDELSQQYGRDPVNYKPGWIRPKLEGD